MIVSLSLISTITAAYFACFGFPIELGYSLFFTFIELWFVADIIHNFFLQYKDEEDFKPVRDIKRITWRYLKRYFIFDLLATIPFNWLVNSNSRSYHLFYLFKLLRLPKLQSVLDSKNF